MQAITLKDEINLWLNNDPEREALLIAKAPIASSTLRLTKQGRYMPGERLENAIRAVMREFPLVTDSPKRSVAGR